MQRTDGNLGTRLPTILSILLILSILSSVSVRRANPVFCRKPVPPSPGFCEPHEELAQRHSL